jgi:hypothetical protein
MARKKKDLPPPHAASTQTHTWARKTRARCVVVPLLLLPTLLKSVQPAPVCESPSPQSPTPCTADCARLLHLTSPPLPHQRSARLRPPHSAAPSASRAAQPLTWHTAVTTEASTHVGYDSGGVYRFLLEVEEPRAEPLVPAGAPLPCAGAGALEPNRLWLHTTGGTHVS